jgi:hypothetical protein
VIGPESLEGFSHPAGITYVGLEKAVIILAFYFLQRLQIARICKFVDGEDLIVFFPDEIADQG